MIEGFGTGLLWGQIREMDLVTFASVLWTQNDGNFAVLSPVICPLSSLSSLFFGVLFFFFFFRLVSFWMITTCLIPFNGTTTSDTFLDLR